MDSFSKVLTKFLIKSFTLKMNIVNNGKVETVIPQAIFKRPIQDRFTEKVVRQSPDQKPSFKKSKHIKGRLELDTNLLKLESDINFLRELLNIFANTFDKDHLISQTLQIINEYKFEFEILECNAKNKKLLMYLERKIKKDEETSKESLLKCEEKIFDLENDVNELEIENAMRLRLVVKWEQTRLEQTQTIFERDMKILFEKAENADLKFNQEMRIYNEIEVYTNNEIEKLEQLTEEYIDRYNNEVATLDQDLKTAKAKIDTAQESSKDLQEMFDQRNQEIADYLEQKRLMEEARKLDQLKWDSAVKIQAWWRGTMVRNCLGPYRRKKKSKKGKSAKKKK